MPHKAIYSKCFRSLFDTIAGKEVVITPEIEKLIKEREAARAAKDWKKSDELRSQLRTLGYEVQDKKQ